MITLRIGWRNLWRNPRRSVITIGGVAFAFAFLIGLVGFGRGLGVQLLRNGTELMLGHIQLHDEDYLPDRTLHRTLGGREGYDWRALVARLRRDPRIEQAVPRVYAAALVSSGEKSSGAQLVGIDPDAERTFSRVLTPAAARALAAPAAVVLGDQLARDLEVGPGDEVAVVTTAFDGTLGNVLLRVGGTLHTGMPHLDRSLTLLRLEAAMDLLAMPPGRIHEIALRVGSPLAAPAVAHVLARDASLPPGARVRSWRELLPQLSSYIQLVDAVNVLIVMLVVLFASMGVLNTMMMATFERVREFGMLTAIGMRPSAITRTVLAESFVLVSLGLAGGAVLGWLMMQYLMAFGINLEWWTGGVAMVNTRMDPVVKAAWDWRLVGYAALCLAAAGVTAAYWPARRATHLPPVEALRAPVLQ